MAKEKGISIKDCMYESYLTLHCKNGKYTSKRAEEIDAKVKEIAATQGVPPYWELAVVKAHIRVICSEGHVALKPWWEFISPASLISPPCHLNDVFPVKSFPPYPSCIDELHCVGLVGSPRLYHPRSMAKTPVLVCVTSDSGRIRSLVISLTLAPCDVFIFAIPKIPLDGISRLQYVSLSSLLTYAASTEGTTAIS
ncbi:hypothetical protein AAHA92_32928 [Salvia divinorum]|uniref:Uncharacterized protein n=1 Tax=Salvia divinorum TaxID=28513 RepID=A0ABD1FMA4_SALDI